MVPLYYYGLPLLCFLHLIILKMQTFKKIIFVLSCIMIVIHVVNYFIYDGETLPTTLAKMLPAICTIIVIVINKKEKK
jgi:hypothetical protein